MKRFLILIGLLVLVTCQPAPKQAEFVGQDYSILSQHADFIKPMLYRQTFATALTAPSSPGTS